jgi:phenylpropionate dioxygenase-like ring-hydroxylating dioxygenase large terminal subunit
LIAVTDKEKFGEFDRSQRGLTELPCREKAGMIFGVLTPGAAIDVDAYFGHILDDFEGVDFHHWTYLGTRVIEGANWKVAYDGYLEGHPASNYNSSADLYQHYALREFRTAPAHRLPADQHR